MATNQTNILQKIAELQEEVHFKRNNEFLHFTSAEEIVIGSNTTICGIYLGTRDEKINFVRVSLSVAEVTTDIALDCLSDNILYQLVFLLNKRLSKC